ncbi:hypothetical protein QMY03_09750 [Arthrobacter sp. KFRI-F3372]|nr:hypothetical protein QMY03_09750 [Arthrobacter sp. KFRI-F3372]
MQSQLHWENGGAWIRPEDERTWDQADFISRIDIEDVEFYDFTGGLFEFNNDTDRMQQLGYRAYFVPGGGIVVESPYTPVTLAADRIW